MTLEESKEVIPMMEAMITQIEEQQNIMAEMLQEIQEKDEKLMCFQEQEERLQQLEIVRVASNLAGYRRTADASGRKDRPDTAIYRRESAMAGIGTEIKQLEPAIAETEQRITELEQQLEKGRLIDERIKKLKERRSTGRVASADRADAGRTRPERPDYLGTENAARRIVDLEREVKQREQSREHSSLKERLEENKRIIAERERENAHRKGHDRGMSR